MRHMRGKLGSWIGVDIHRRLRPPSNLPRLLERRQGLRSLPPRAVVSALTDSLFDTPIVMAIIHRPTFDYRLNLIYTLDERDHGMEEIQFIQLLYSMVALGYLCSRANFDSAGYEQALANGTKYFRIIRDSVDMDNCTDLVSLQTIVFLNFFLVFTTRLTTCYTYNSITLSLAIRMGLHQNIRSTHDMIKLETQKRVFWTIWLISSYVSTSLGLPNQINEEEIDQVLPIEVEDKNIGVSEIIPQCQGDVPPIVGFNKFVKLQRIRQKVMKHVYPTKGMKQRLEDGTMSYVLSMAKLSELEQELTEWRRDLPHKLTLYQGAPRNLLRTQYLLSMSYAHSRVILYRPFLKHIEKGDQRQANNQLHSFAVNCVRESQIIIHLNEDMYRQGLPTALNWTATHMMLSAMLCLIYVLFHSPGPGESKEILNDLVTGQNTLGNLAQCNVTAGWHSSVLKVLISLFPEELNSARGRLKTCGNSDSFSPDASHLSQRGSFQEYSYNSSLAHPIFAIHNPMTSQAGTISTAVVPQPQDTLETAKPCSHNISFRDSRTEHVSRGLSNETFPIFQQQQTCGDNTSLGEDSEDLSVHRAYNMRTIMTPVSRIDVDTLYNNYTHDRSCGFAGLGEIGTRSDGAGGTGELSESLMAFMPYEMDAFENFLKF
ncbi:fungal-specific transcription factor domain-containing protein [Xylogone sp. PMI_703]|nr:fungal-specific transcription factor domain-containing protein [Xylogone sp. PMI_703]